MFAGLWMTSDDVFDVSSSYACGRKQKSKESPQKI
jgi:hypothetical protein